MEIQNVCDVYIPETRVIIETEESWKSIGSEIRIQEMLILLHLNRADRYNGKLTFDERARWIVTSNFAEIWIYDMNQETARTDKDCFR